MMINMLDDYPVVKIYFVDFEYFGTDPFTEQNYKFDILKLWKSLKTFLLRRI